jgi:hypothetical protein
MNLVKGLTTADFISAYPRREKKPADYEQSKKSCPKSKFYGQNTQYIVV